MKKTEHIQYEMVIKVVTVLLLPIPAIITPYLLPTAICCGNSLELFTVHHVASFLKKRCFLNSSLEPYKV